MKETIHKLKTKGLYVISIQSSSYRWCKLVSAKNNLPIRNYTAKPILKITDFLKLFDEYLGHLNCEKLSRKWKKELLRMIWAN
jgi:hypothetical protein